MCAIAGIIGSKSDVASTQENLKAMLRLMHHRGPDESGFSCDDKAAIGHNRLSIIDISSRNLYPMLSNDGRYVLTFNGEIFNYLEIKDELRHHYKFKTKMDSEVLLAAYSHWGKHCLGKLRGMFAFAIWDRTEQRLFAARDPFGIKPFYYTANGKHTVNGKNDEFRFASEIKPLLNNNKYHGNKKSCIQANESVIHQYLIQGLYDHSNETFFQDVIKLEAAHYLEYHAGEISTHRYWNLDNLPSNGVGHDIDEAINQASSQAEVQQRLKYKIQESIDIALRSDVPLGLNISGGFDSSLLSQLVTSSDAFNSGELHCFSQDYRDTRFSERKKIERNLAGLNTDVSYSYISPNDFLQAQDTLQWHQEEPYAGLPVAGYIGLYQAAHRQKITVLLDGNGLDEGAGGYKSYHAAYLNDLSAAGSNELSIARRQYCEEWVTELSEQQLSQTKQDNSLAGDGTRLIHLNLLNSSFKNGKKRFSRPAPQSHLSSARQTMLADIYYKKLPRALRFNDKISMAFSKELRVPYLDRELFELFFSIPDHLLFSNHRPKGLLRSLFNTVGNQDVLQAPKQSIQTPQSEWFKTTLYDWLYDTITSTSFRNRPFYNAKAVEAHLLGLKRNDTKLTNSFYLWQMLNLDGWYRQFIESRDFELPPKSFPEVEIELPKHPDKAM